MYKQTPSGIWTYIPEFFSLEEFFPPEQEHLFGVVLGDVPVIWMGIDDRVKWTADQLRMIYGTAIMNTWHSVRMQSRYGFHRYRGWRSRDCSVGAQFSQHKMGCAADIVFTGVEADAVRSDILANPHQEEFQFITFLEMNVSWLHFDCRPHDKLNAGIIQYAP